MVASALRRTVLILIVSLSGTAFSHPADISYLRVNVAPQRIEFRYSLNLATLARIARIDANGDNQVTFAEIKVLAPAVVAFLTTSSRIAINDNSSSLGDFESYECIWPNAETTVLTPHDADQRFVDFRFVQDWPQVVATLQLHLEDCQALGELHTIEATFEQSGEPATPVTFSRAEPSFIYDTGWNAHTSVANTTQQRFSPNMLIWASVVMLTGAGLRTLCRQRA